MIKNSIFKKDYLSAKKVWGIDTDDALLVCDKNSAGEIKKRLSFDAEVVYYPSVDSTNTQAKRLAGEGKAQPFLVAAGEQTAGRGRQGKSFYSPAGTGIYMSLALCPKAQLKDTVCATTAAAVAVCRAIEKLTDIKPQIKWVNDIYVGGKKVCGILTEAVCDSKTNAVTSLIIGIGLNIKTKEFPKEIKNAASLNAAVKRADLIAETANELIKLFGKEYSEFIDYYRSRSLVTGKKISFVKNGEATSAIALGIDNYGGLAVKTDSGETLTLRSGEISVILTD